MADEYRCCAKADGLDVFWWFTSPDAHRCSRDPHHLNLDEAAVQDVWIYRFCFNRDWRLDSLEEIFYYALIYDLELDSLLLVSIEMCERCFCRDLSLTERVYQTEKCLMDVKYKQDTVRWILIWSFTVDVCVDCCYKHCTAKYAVLN